MSKFIPTPFGHVAMDEPERGPAHRSRSADVHVRVPAELKDGIDAAARRAGAPADLWLLDALGGGVGSAGAWHRGTLYDTRPAHAPHPQHVGRDQAGHRRGPRDDGRARGPA